MKIWLQCDRGGEPKSKATVRRSCSKKVDCPFSLIGKLGTSSGNWSLVEKKNIHTDEPAKFLEGHAFARRLTPDEESLVERLYLQNREPTNIHLTIRKQNSHIVCIIQDIQNMIKKIKLKMYGDRTPTQILENMLQEERYVYFTRVNPPTNTVEEVFFVHPDSYNMWRAFPHVLMIDATYKTNEYKLLFIQVVGVTSTHKSFCVAHAFVAKEKQDNFLWVLEKLKELLVDCMEPRVIVTDSDQALMNSCDKVFPKASILLCRWHLSQNILKHYRAKFTDEDWKIFKLSWSRLCSSPTPTLYNYNFERLFTRPTNDERSDVLDYLYNVWLKDYKEKFVSAWTNTVPNFGQHTTNRVESQHSKFKRYIKGPNNSLHRLVWLVGKVVESQHIQIKPSFQENKSVQMGDHKIPFFDNLRGKVSQKALELLLVERKKLHALRVAGGGGTCGHQLSTGCGLPCACQMEWWESTGLGFDGG
ncbi:protein FAR-RED IMPAIRED RESPONSE 1-like [Helianthus annuus]|uniref:protein FAR-RED IMPAIRED RESPONSE 1-like n=1 Tax=Helianthus annuus TaxID=4232 RepID=UPI000B9088E8|nr:protein FAR-RED IMPAIRED RESPONSE 1-like [Helianthus annuus]